MSRSESESYFRGISATLNLLTLAKGFDYHGRDFFGFAVARDIDT